MLNGDFIEGNMHKLYDAEANQFLADRFVVGTCPNVALKKVMAINVNTVEPAHNATDLIIQNLLLQEIPQHLRKLNIGFYL